MGNYLFSRGSQLSQAAAERQASGKPTRKRRRRKKCLSTVEQIAANRRFAAVQITAVQQRLHG